MDDDDNKKHLWWRYLAVGVLTSSFIIHLDGYFKAAFFFAFLRLIAASVSMALMVWLIHEIATIRQTKN